MVKAPSRIVLVVAVVMAIFALIVVNQMGQKNVPKSDEEIQAELTQQQQKAAQEAAKKNPPSAAAPVAASTDDLVLLGSDATLGSMSSAAPEVTVRWAWTPSVQSDPNKLNAGIKALLSAAPQARVHVVNTDETPGVPNGVFVGDKIITLPAADGNLAIDPSAVRAALPK